LGRARTSQAECGILSLGRVDVDHVTRRRHRHARGRAQRADRFGSLDLDLDDEINPVSTRAPENLTHHSVDRQHGVVAARVRSILCRTHDPFAQDDRCNHQHRRMQSRS
jgi:hypothetical protein